MDHSCSYTPHTFPKIPLNFIHPVRFSEKPVCVLANKGLGNWEIAQELEIHKSTVSRYVNRGKEEGIIKPLNS